MIQIRELTEADSEDCIQLKLNRQRYDSVKVLETRKKNFFGIYKFYSNEFISYGAFEGNSLIGMCSFIKLNGPVTRYFVTDLVVLKEYSGSYVGPRILDIFWNEKLINLPSFELYAVEETLNSLETFKNYLKRYDIISLEDRYVYTHLKKIISTEKGKAIFNSSTNEISRMDKDAVHVTIADEGFDFFTDDIFRTHTENKQNVTRLYVKGPILKIMDKVIPIMSQWASERNIDYILILSEEKISSTFDYIYMNRVLSFSKNTAMISTLDFDNGILI